MAVPDPASAWLANRRYSSSTTGRLPRKWSTRMIWSSSNTARSRALSSRAEFRSWPNGFSTATRASSTNPAFAEILDDRREQERRHFQVVEGTLPNRFAWPAARRAAVGDVAVDGSTNGRPAGRTPHRRSSRPDVADGPAGAFDQFSTVMSSLATPMIGQSNSLRDSSRYRARNVILRARSPVIPKITSRSEASPPLSANPPPPGSHSDTT